MTSIRKHWLIHVSIKIWHRFFGLERMVGCLKSWEIHKILSRLCAYCGTNGKGSTVNALQTIFTRRASRLETLPHPILLTSRNEFPLTVDDFRRDLLDLVNRVKPVWTSTKKTEHENATELEIISCVLMFLYKPGLSWWDIASLKLEWVVFLSELNLFSFPG